MLRDKSMQFGRAVENCIQSVCLPLLLIFFKGRKLIAICVPGYRRIRKIESHVSPGFPKTLYFFDSSRLGLARRRSDAIAKYADQNVSRINDLFVEEALRAISGCRIRMAFPPYRMKHDF